MKRYLLEIGEVDSRLDSRDGLSWTDGRILDASGFLIRPSEYFRLTTLPEVAEAGSFVLVAEGGMGKSFILRQFEESDPGKVERIELVLFENDSKSLQNELEAKAAPGKCLLLDGLDEATGLCPTLIRCLQRSGFPSRVVIASRGIPQLKDLCARLKLPVYSLLPYTQDDVRSRCEDRKKDFDAFLRAVEGAGLGAVCARPLGCNLLLDSFEDGKLASESSETLWRNSILRLCAENEFSNSVSMANPKRKATPTDCWDIACRAALALKLSGCSVLPRITPLPAPDGIDVERLFPADLRDKYDECLWRALFVNIGGDRFRFAHSTYLDFMAAMGLVEFVAPSGWAKFVLSPEGNPYPQWEGVLPWLAARDTGLLERVKKARPDLLLGSDAVLSKVGAEEVCRCILENAESIPATIRGNPAIQARYYALSTEGCVRRVADALRNATSTTVVDTAIDIVQRARVPAMIDALVEFFCDENKDLSLRVSAGYVLCELADAGQRKRCRAVLALDVPSRMKLVVARLLWPQHMTAKEMIPLLNVGKNNGVDSFSIWLLGTFPSTLSGLSEADLLDLLEWSVEEVGKDKFEEHALFDAKAAVFRRCWQLPFTQRSLPLLAKGLAAYAKVYRSPFEGSKYSSERKNEEYCGKDYAADVERRRTMAKFIAESGEASLSDVVHWPIHLLHNDDIDFVVEQIKANSDVAQRMRWVECLRWLEDGIELPKQAGLWDWLHKEFPDRFERDAKSTLQERRKQRRIWKRRERAWTDESARRSRKYAEIRSHNAAWAHEHLRSSPDPETFFGIMGAIYQAIPPEARGFGLDFRKSDLWNRFSQEEISVLVSAAYDSLIAYNGPVSTGDEYHPVLLQAIYLLTAYDQLRLRDLPPAVWRRFSPELLRGLDYTDVDLVPLTLKCFKESQPEVFFEELNSRLKTRLTERQYLELKMFKGILDDILARRLLTSLDELGLSDEQKLALYCVFWDVNSALTSKHIQESKLSRLPLDGCDVSMSVFLIASEPNRRIPELLQLLVEKPEWGHNWIERVFGKEDQLNGIIVGLFKKLSVNELKDLYASHLELFPPEKDPMREGVSTRTGLDNVYHNRHFIFNELISRIDDDLPRALQDLQKRFPRLWYLHEHELRAKRKLLERACPAYDMDAILKIIERRTSVGVIHTSEDLLELVLDALDKYQIHLNGEENPRVGDLWNEKYPVSPKDEGCLCDHLKDFLDRELPRAVINREVQLRRKTSKTKGARTDLWITAFSKKDGSRVRLCIEVKGDWNPEWKTAFRNQLCERYMGKGGADAGIFLLGWFGAGKTAKGRRSIIAMDAAVKLLEKQQAELVGEKHLVRSVVLDCTY